MEQLDLRATLQKSLWTFKEIAGAMETAAQLLSTPRSIEELYQAADDLMIAYDEIVYAYERETSTELYPTGFSLVCPIEPNKETL